MCHCGFLLKNALKGKRILRTGCFARKSSSVVPQGYRAHLWFKDTQLPNPAPRPGEGVLPSTPNEVNHKNVPL